MCVQKKALWEEKCSFASEALSPGEQKATRLQLPDQFFTIFKPQNPFRNEILLFPKTSTSNFYDQKNLKCSVGYSFRLTHTHTTKAVSSKLRVSKVN